MDPNAKYNPETALPLTKARHYSKRRYQRPNLFQQDGLTFAEFEDGTIYGLRIKLKKDRLGAPIAKFQYYRIKTDGAY